MPEPRLARWVPASLAGRFAFATAGLVTLALIVTSLASWWLIYQQQQAVDNLRRHELSFRAAAVGSDLQALAVRMAEIAGSTILATGLVDSVGRETYLTPFLGGIRQINGIPIQVVFTDFEGREIASNVGARFSAEQMAWLRQVIQSGLARAQIFPGPGGSELVAVEPMVYARTSSPEGAVLYKIALDDINVGSGVRLQWGDAATTPDTQSQAVQAPQVFAGLQFRVERADLPAEDGLRLPLPYLHIVAIALGVFALVVLAGLRLARVLTRDLQQLDTFATQLQGGRLHAAEAPEGNSAEVASLARSINAMLQRLGEQHDTLLQEREKLTRLTNTLQAADRRKDDFLAMLGHELRNPLAPIRTAAEVLSMLGSGDPRLAQASQIIVRQASHMTKLIEDLLDVSRVTRGLVTLERSEVDFRSALAAALEQLRPAIEGARHSLTVTVPDEPLHVLGDSARLVQIFGNLLANAAKYTPAGGRIEVEVHAEPGRIVTEVRDNGVGNSPELMPEIFDLFTQDSRTADRRLGGLGLGLALVKHLVELHGGEVRAESEGQGRGARFTVSLPRLAARTAVALPPPSAARPNTLVDALDRPLQVLIVDDNRDAADMLAAMLEEEGHHVHAVYGADEALALAGRQPLDACILDIGLPGMDGYELAQRLRALPHTSQALLVALTGYGQASDRARAMQAGFDEHMVKPADADAIRRVLRRSKALVFSH
jgi:signal transduction histidine kinase/ActR/RegA family two-component response regulator